MIDPGLRQEAERSNAGLIWLVGLASVVISALLVALAWLFVAPPPVARHPPAQPSPLEHGLFDRATGGDDARAAGVQRLERYEWVDRRTGVVRIPIDRAIDAVVADPGMIGTEPSATLGALEGDHDRDPEGEREMTP
jgi:hypothetical protein